MHGKEARAIGASSVLAAFALALAFFLFSAVPAHAVEGDDLPDVMLGVFTNSGNDTTDSIYMSADGVNFEKISEAYTDMAPWDPNENRAVQSWAGGRTWDIYSHVCPSIIYHNGYFWMLSNEPHDYGGQLSLMISNSKDLVNWSDPTRVTVPVEAGWQSNYHGGFDAVAADWAVAPDGNIYVSASIGYYGAYWGDPENDTMYPYMVKISQLSSNNDPAVNAINFSPTVVADQALYINLQSGSTNIIDGSWYFEGNTAYYCVKINGVHNQIWSTPLDQMWNIGNRGAWTLVGEGFSEGYEAPSLTKFKNTYYMFTDCIYTYWGTAGTYSRTSSTLWGNNWSYESRLNTYTSNGTPLSHYYSGANTDGPRHGTVITITDPAAKKVIWDARARAGWTTELPGAELPRIFDDVPHGAWYEDTIKLISDRGIMSGYADGTFGVGKSITRAELAMTMWKYADNASATAGTLSANETGMADVDDYQWYTAAANWAVENNVINGVPQDDGTYLFNPNGQVTFNELIQVLANYVAATTGVPSEGDLVVLEQFSDADQVGWAAPAMSWAVEKGLVSGANGMINPNENVARERVATVIAKAIQTGVM